jgi:hypothetical protein
VQHNFPESDWKIFRRLREVALERFCKRILAETGRFLEDGPRSAHDRYLELFNWLGERNTDMADAFDNPRRSRMLWQLAAIHAEDLLEADEFAQFTPSTRETVQFLSKEFKQ